MYESWSENVAGISGEKEGNKKKHGRFKEMGDSKQNKRVIWILENGRRKYSQKGGKPELWSSEEIRTLIEPRKKSNDLGCYSPDYSFYFAAVSAAKNLGFEDCVKIVGYATQLSSLPVNPEYLW